MKFRSVVELYEDNTAKAKAAKRLDAIGGAVSFMLLLK